MVNDAAFLAGTGAFGGGKKKALALGLLLATLVVAGLSLSAKPAYALTLTVDRIDDPDPTTASACDAAAANDCSLRGAIVRANALAGADTITVPASATPYTLTRPGADENAASTGDLDITGPTTITGAGARTTTVAGGAAPFADRIFDNQPSATATITGLTITGGKSFPTSYSSNQGGGVYNSGTLTLDEVAVKNNTAGYIGGVYGQDGTLTITDSTVSGNSATTNVGGVGQTTGTANIANSTISGNQAANLVGGASFTGGVVVNIQSSTIASNTSAQAGGGIYISASNTKINVKNTIVSANTTTTNCNTSSGIASLGNNISSDDSCGFTQPTDKPSTDPLLGPLANNGGQTDTHALLGSSPAIDTGDTALTADQRGISRPQDGDKNGTANDDIGAFEGDTRAPTVKSLVATSRTTTGVPLRKTNFLATFSEKMTNTTLNKSTYKLYKCPTVTSTNCTTQVTSVGVTPSADGLSATLNPYGVTTGLLAPNTRYKVVVTTGAKDAAGNALDQNSSVAGSQQQVSYFKTGSS